MDFEFVRIWLPLFTSVSALVLSVYFSTRNMRMTQRTAAFNLFEKYNDDYFSKDLGSAFVVISKLKKDRSALKSPIDPEKLKKWKHTMKALDDPSTPNADIVEAKEIDAARRTIKRYYHKIAHLYHSGIISKKKVAILCKKGGVHLYIDILKPLELAIQKDSPDIDYFDTIERIVHNIEKFTKTNKK